MLTENLATASNTRALCKECKLFSKCTFPFMRPFIPKNWTGKILFIGEAPGEHEDEVSHRPFTGKAGKLFTTEIIPAIPLSMQDVVLVNSVRCRPKNNASPTMNQLRACRPFLLQVISKLRPEFIVCLGRVALQAIQNSGVANITKSRGRRITIPEYPQMRAYCTWHPAAIFYTEGYRLKLEIIKDIKNIITPQLESPQIGLPSGDIIFIDTEYSNKVLLTLGIADEKACIAFE